MQSNKKIICFDMPLFDFDSNCSLYYRLQSNNIPNGYIKFQWVGCSKEGASKVMEAEEEEEEEEEKEELQEEGEVEEEEEEAEEEEEEEEEKEEEKEEVQTLIPFPNSIKVLKNKMQSNQNLACIQMPK